MYLLGLPPISVLILICIEVAVRLSVALNRTNLSRNLVTPFPTEETRDTKTAKRWEIVLRVL